MCYVHNQWYDISCATLYNSHEVAEYYEQALKKTDKRASLVIF